MCSTKLQHCNNSSLTWGTWEACNSWPARKWQIKLLLRALCLSSSPVDGTACWWAWPAEPSLCPPSPCRTQTLGQYSRQMFQSGTPLGQTLKMKWNTKHKIFNSELVHGLAEAHLLKNMPSLIFWDIRLVHKSDGVNTKPVLLDVRCRGNAQTVISPNQWG